MLRTSVFFSTVIIALLPTAVRSAENRNHFWQIYLDGNIPTQRYTAQV